MLVDHLRDHAVCLRTTVIVLLQGWSTSVCTRCIVRIAPPSNLFHHTNPSCESMLPEGSGFFAISAIIDQLMSVFVHVAVPQIDQVRGVKRIGNEIPQHSSLRPGLSLTSQHRMNSTELIAVQVFFCVFRCGKFPISEQQEEEIDMLGMIGFQASCFSWRHGKPSPYI